MFLAGIENNQDIVTMTAYAPLFENVNFSAWKPNLISFDNYRVYGIPTYHMLSMMAANRGREVVKLSVETEKYFRTVSGLPGIMAAKGGMCFRNVTHNGKPAAISHTVQGFFSENNGEYTAASDPAAQALFFEPRFKVLGSAVWAVLGEEPSKIYEFQADVKSDQDNPITITVWCHRPLSYFNIDETAGDVWNMHSVRRYDWTVSGLVSTVSHRSMWHNVPLAEDTAVKVNLGEYNTYRVVTREDGFDCYINGKLVQKAFIPNHSRLAACAATEDGSVIIKIVNVKTAPDDVEISLDCRVLSEYEAQLLSADDMDECNSLDEPLRVSPVSRVLNGAASNFTYHAPPCSLSILRLRTSTEGK
jgi:hypothetical protein